MKETAPDPQNHPVRENPRWLRFESRVQQYGAYLLFLIVISALAGLFSHGFLSDRTQETGDKQLQVHYERFGRLQSDMALAVTVRAPKHEQLVITLGGDFMQQYEIRTLQPQPDQVSSRNGVLRLEYSHAHPGDVFDLWLGLTPQLPGSATSQIGVEGASSTSIWQFIYP